jgi:hypothetical protein
VRCQSERPVRGSPRALRRPVPEGTTKPTRPVPLPDGAVSNQVETERPFGIATRKDPTDQPQDSRSQEGREGQDVRGAPPALDDPRPARVQAPDDSTRRRSLREARRDVEAVGGRAQWREGKAAKPKAGRSRRSDAPSSPREDKERHPWRIGLGCLGHSPETRYLQTSSLIFARVSLASPPTAWRSSSSRPSPGVVAASMRSATAVPCLYTRTRFSW